MRKQILTILTFIVALLFCGSAAAQQHGAPKIEVGAQFSSLSLNVPDSSGWLTEAGFGARFTFNINDHIAVEAEGNFYPQKTFQSLRMGGRITQAQLGVKAGKRYERFGIFAKARPGFVSFGEVIKVTGIRREKLFGGGEFDVVETTQERQTHFSTDIGGVLEFYPSRRIVTRFDAGDTIIRYGETQTVEPIPGGISLLRLTRAPAQTRHNFQFTASVAYRFRDSGATDDAGASASDDGTPRWELGAQFTSLLFNDPERNFQALSIVGAGGRVRNEPGVGARLTYNFNEHFAAEAVGNIFTTRSFPGEVTGGIPFQGQFGIKAGKRYDKFGIFAKARPGFVGFTDVREVTGTQTINFNGLPVTIPIFNNTSKTYFSTDLGGVVEFYPSRRIMTRMDFGDTLIHYPRRLAVAFPVIEVPAQTRHNFQFTAGIGLRF